MISHREDFYNLYNSIMNLDSKVRFVTILGKTGTILFGGQREGIQNYLSEEDQAKSIKHVTNAWINRNQLSSGIGDVKYAMAEYGKVKRFTIPLNESHLIYITTEPEIDPKSFIDDVLKIKESL